MRLLRNPRPIVVRAARLHRKPTAWPARARVARQGLRSGRSNASRTPCGRASGSAPPASFAPRARKPGRVVAAACPSELPLTPTGRLGVMEGRVNPTMLQAIATLRPALAKFYATLNDEQKARFNRTLLTGDRRNG